jgi:hypothetical protein
MTEQQAWTVLGIAATEAQIEIRRAYSRALKAIDPDADPQAFIELREARDLLMHRAQQPAGGNGEAGQPLPAAAPDLPRGDDAAPEPLVINVGNLPEEVLEAEAAARDGDEGGRIDPALFATIERILFEDKGPVDEAALDRATQALLAHPGMERIDTAAAVEGWLARAIIGGRPRSDVMIEPTINRFGWDRMGDDWRRPQALDIILQRRADREFETFLLGEHKRYRPIFALLHKKEPPGLFTRLWRTADMHAFLAYAWPRHPTTIESFDPDALAYWEKRVFQPQKLQGKFNNWRQGWRGDNDGQRLIGGRGNGWAQVLIAVFLISVLSSIFSQGRRPARPVRPPVEMPMPGQLWSNADQDLTPIFRRAFGEGMTPGQLRRIKPALYQSLVMRWTEASAANEARGSFEDDVWQRIDDAYRAGLRGGDHALLAAYWRFAADRLIWIRSGLAGENSCAEFLQGNPGAVPPFPDRLLDRERALRVRAMAVARPRQADGDSSYPIPEAVARQAMRAAGVDLATMRAVLRGGASPAARCNVRIALIESGLAQPSAQGTAFLRDMLG